MLPQALTSWAMAATLPTNLGTDSRPLVWCRQAGAPFRPDIPWVISVRCLSAVSQCGFSVRFLSAVTRPAGPRGFDYREAQPSMLSVVSCQCLDAGQQPS